jgi:hypothetical protein
MRRIAITAGTILLLASFVDAQGDPLAPLHFLLGDWTAVDVPAGETGTFSFKLAVQNHVIVRTNKARYAATAKRPASRHDDLLVIYNELGSLRAEYFDNEGHVIRYAVQPGPSRDAVVFISDPHPAEPRYRLAYTRGTDGLLRGSFELAPPSSPDAFQPYLTWKARRRPR